MPINKALIYDADGANSTRDRIVRESPSGRQTIVMTSDAAAIPSLARELAGQGAVLIELCGGISPVTRAKTAAAVKGRAQVSSVTFGIESLLPAAAFNKAYLEGRPPRAAVVILETGANPHRDRFDWDFAPLGITFVPVPDEAAASAVATELVENGYGLIELYGGFSTQGAAGVLEAVAGRAPVGIGSFALDAVDAAIWATALPT